MDKISISTVLASVVVSSMITTLALIWNERKRRESEERRFKIDAAMKLTELAHGQINEIFKYKSPAVKIKVPKVLRTFLDYIDWIEKLWSNEIIKKKEHGRTFYSKK